MVGIDLHQRLNDDGLSLVGRWGVALLVFLVPSFFIVGIGLLLALELVSLLWGFLFYLFLLFLPYIGNFYSTKSGKKSPSD